MATPEQRPTPAVSGPADAESLVAAIVEQITTLERIIQEETGLLKASRLRDAAALSGTKSDAARHYVHALESLKANAIALARWSPQGVARLKAAQARLADALSVNMAVLATARSVSEGIVRSLASEVAAPKTLNTYGAGGKSATGTRQTATPLMVSRSL
jgi:hypothetical protein